MKEVSATKPRKPYPFIGVRFSKSVDKRIRRLSKVSDKSISHLLNAMVMKHLPELEKEAEEAAAKVS